MNEANSPGEPGALLFVEEGGQLRLMEKSVEQLAAEADEEEEASPTAHGPQTIRPRER
jgi:hypothetical protein